MYINFVVVKLLRNIEPAKILTTIRSGNREREWQGSVWESGRDFADLYGRVAAICMGEWQWFVRLLSETHWADF